MSAEKFFNSTERFSLEEKELLLLYNGLEYFSLNRLSSEGF